MERLFDPLFETLPGTGWLTKSEARVLWDWALQTTGPILEVGCYYGRSTVLLAALNRPMYCIDPFENFDSNDLEGFKIRECFLANILERGISNAALFTTKIEDWAIQPAGFAYLDGDHTYDGTLFQINTALSCGVTKLCIHDYAEEGGGLQVKHAIENSGRLNLSGVVERMAFCEVVQ